jgi:hypothetical protein
MKLKPIRFDPNLVRTRDHALVALIRGATKAAVHVDRRKEASRRACRRSTGRSACGRERHGAAPHRETSP